MKTRRYNYAAEFLCRGVRDGNRSKYNVHDARMIYQQKIPQTTKT
jgi:hypothetical protein